MIYWATFSDDGKLYEVRVGGNPTADATKITSSQYLDIISSSQGDSWIKDNTSIIKVSNTPSLVTSPIQVVSMRQARRALYQLGYLTQVEDFIKLAPNEFKIDWEYAIEVRRENDLVEYMRQVLQLTHEQIDDLFTLAHSL